MALRGKTAFVTGAGGGIGRATALAMARAGARLAVVDLRAESVEETARLIAEAGGEALALVADVTDGGAVREAVSRTVERFGGLDCAHNNAGIALPAAPFERFTADDLALTFAVNVHGVFHCMQAQIAAMLDRGGGTIVNTASIAGLVGAPGNSVYGASKQAVMGLTRSVAVEYAGRGIRVNAVCPGIVETAMTAPGLADEAARAATRAAIPAGRLGTPEEIADVVVWLSSPQSTYVLGACITADGGYSVP